jgi:hypothetical protein
MAKPPTNCQKKPLLITLRMTHAFVVGRAGHSPCPIADAEIVSLRPVRNIIYRNAALTPRGRSVHRSAG